MSSPTPSRRLLRWAAAALSSLLLAGCQSPAPRAPAVPLAPPGPPSSVIFIGNSFFYYNNGINNFITPLVRAGNPGAPWRTTMVTISGSGFDWHDVDSYFRPNAIGQYSFDPNNRVVFNKLERLFDVAVLMDCSQCPIHPQLAPVFREYAKKNADSVRRHGARPAFFMSWAYADQPEMTQQLARAYAEAGKEHDAIVIPAGLAFARSIRDRPDINLYAPDKRHPSVAGSYLAACTTYATLFGRSPVGLRATGGLDSDTAAFLQNVAWQTVQSYRGN
ncbi:MAG TPA: hypothetical protein PKA20_24950 [Burkholderiaceae bacterium]|nr:hypothetical protein [Burkholderiaceae bacterium]